MAWRFGSYELDVGRREFRAAGAIQPLQPQVFAVLEYLVRHRNHVVSKDELLRELWPDAVVTDASLQRAVSLARRALRPADRGLLRTHARRGYRFVGEVTGIDPDAADAAAGERPSYLRRGDVHIAYRVVGEGPVDVVLVLGWSLGMRSALALGGAAEIVRALSRHARVVMFDKRGTGASDRVKVLPRLPERVDDLVALLDAVRSPGAVLVGFSEGGPMAVTLSVKCPSRVRGLALVGAFARMAAAPDHPHGWTDGEIATLRGYIQSGWGSGATIRALIPKRHLTEPAAAWAARAEQEGASPGAALDLLEMNLDIDVRALLHLVRVPTVVLHAAGDRVVRFGNGRALAGAIPGSRLVEAQGDDHAFLFDGRPRLERELLALVAAARRGHAVT
ncbi:MAG TPA: alpha/beta fold hydrolase [Anaeromyxobacteraceae bacterium]|nr:alpha/beta fold hydrolase [Anaeromyxobacteraceae bacterium]